MFENERALKKRDKLVFPVMNERRRHVRAKPTAELPAHILYDVVPPITEALGLVDISVSGVAVETPMKKPEVGTVLSLKLVLGSDSHALRATVRWVAGNMMGLEMLEPSPETAKAVSRYVSELLERG